jgi:hypothetical protein
MSYAAGISLCDPELIDFRAHRQKRGSFRVKDYGGANERSQ